MMMLLILAVLSTAAIVGSVVNLSRDGYRAVRTDWMRVPDRHA